MKYNPPLDIGNVITGPKMYQYEVGKQYDWIYRLCHIKAISDYSEFYWMCPLLGPTLVGKTLEEAVAYIEQEHLNEGCKPAGHAFDEEDLGENVERVYFGEEVPF